MKKIILLYTIICNSLLLSAQTSSATLQGKIIDAQHGEDVIGAYVKILKNNTQIALRSTDFEGNYSIVVTPGTYDIEASYVGLTTQLIKGVVLNGGRITTLDIKMENTSSVLDAVLIKEYKVPMIQSDNTTSGSIITSEQICSMPTRNVSNVRLINPNLQGEVTVKGSRKEGTVYMVDGVRVQSSSGLPPIDNTKVQLNNPNLINPDNDITQERYNTFEENIFHTPYVRPLSTFSIDVDKASYSNIRRMINNQQSIPSEAVRIEEMINYFEYDYDAPKNNAPFSIVTEVGVCPWNKQNQLLHIALQGKKANFDALPPSNLVFLIDVSGSMESEDKLPLLIESFKFLVAQLRKEDKVAIVVYAGAAGLVLPSTSGDQKELINAKLNALQAGGSTAGGQGIELAYKIAQEQFIQNGNNRVILATDGDFNVGVSSTGDLSRLIESKKDNGIFLTCLGFGMGNYRDDTMQTLSQKGNGNAMYIDNIKEAQKVFGQELTGTLFTIAKDVKIQIEFNPLVVHSYRLIGYETRFLNDEDFKDDKKDAGELGAGHTVTALYEVTLATESPQTADIKDTDPLRYQIPPKKHKNSKDELAFVKLRYKTPESSTSQLITHTVNTKIENQNTDNFNWAATIAAFGQVLKNSKFKGDITLDAIENLAKSAKGKDRNGYRSEFIELIQKYQRKT